MDGDVLTPPVHSGSAHWTESVLQDVDVDGDGAISFDELRAASMDSSVLMRKDLLEKVAAGLSPHAARMCACAHVRT